MIKADIVSALCEKGYYKEQANQVLDDILEAISGALSNGDQVHLRGFGTFETRVRKGRRYNDISMNQVVMTEDMVIPVFRPSRRLKHAVRGAGKSERDGENE